MSHHDNPMKRCSTRKFITFWLILIINLLTLFSNELHRDCKISWLSKPWKNFNSSFNVIDSSIVTNPITRIQRRLKKNFSGIIHYRLKIWFAETIKIGHHNWAFFIFNHIPHSFHFYSIQLKETIGNTRGQSLWYKLYIELIISERRWVERMPSDWSWEVSSVTA